MTGKEPCWYNLLKAWQEAETVYLMSLVREKDELGRQIPPFPPPSSRMTLSANLTKAQRADVGALQHPIPFPGLMMLLMFCCWICCTLPGWCVCLDGVRYSIMGTTCVPLQWLHCFGIQDAKTMLALQTFKFNVLHKSGVQMVVAQMVKWRGRLGRKATLSLWPSDKNWCLY